jgi:hypothetical protein
MSFSINRIKDMDEFTLPNDAYDDLCVTCKNYDSCIFVKNGKRPVHRCEEFEIHELRPVKESGNPGNPENRDEGPVFYGLCKNCGNRLTCMNASPDRIIWHCEEYV